LSLGYAFSGKSRKSLRMWWPETGSNRRRRPFQGRALPLSYLALALQRLISGIAKNARTYFSNFRLSHRPVSGVPNAGGEPAVQTQFKYSNRRLDRQLRFASRYPSFIPAS
jgi:hypothetical protein